MMKEADSQKQTASQTDTQMDKCTPLHSPSEQTGSQTSRRTDYTPLGMLLMHDVRRIDGAHYCGVAGSPADLIVLYEALCRGARQ
jgi:hypothetical protein